MSPVKDHIKATPYLLTGKVVEILDSGTRDGRDYHAFLHSIGVQDTISHGYTVKFRITESFKGKYKAGDTIEIHSKYSSCNMLFNMGNSYVLFLHKEQDNLFPTYCSYSENLDGSLASNKLMQAIYKEFKKGRKQ
jgi:hypothetical protein